MKRILLILMLIVFTRSFSQDVAFTQSFLIPESINPSFSGIYQTTKAGLLHKNQQWSGFNFNLNSQFVYFDDWYPSLNSGVGISLINLQETVTNYNLKQVNVNWAYDVPLNYDWHFRPSVSVGFGSKNYGFDNLLFEDQIDIFQNIINSNTFDPIVLNENIRYVDFGASFLFNNDYSWIGLTLRHLNKPNISMVSQGDTPLDIFVSLHSSLKLPVLKYNDDNSVFLVTNFMMQGKYNRFDLGFQYVFDRFSLGATAATNPIQTYSKSHFVTSINPVIGMAWQGFKFGYSYDFNLTRVGGDGGILEFSISYDFQNDKECFGCPNY